MLTATHDWYFGVSPEALQIYRRARGRQGHALREALKRAFLDRPCARRRAEWRVGAEGWAPQGLNKRMTFRPV